MSVRPSVINGSLIMFILALIVHVGREAPGVWRDAPVALGAPGGWREAPVALGAPGCWREAPVALSAPGGWREAPVALSASGVWREAPVALGAALGSPGSWRGAPVALGAPCGWREALVALSVLSGERDALVTLDVERAAPFDDFIDGEDAAPLNVYIDLSCYVDWFEGWVYSMESTRARAPSAALLLDKLMSGLLTPASTQRGRWLRASKQFETCTKLSRRTRALMPPLARAARTRRSHGPAPLARTGAARGRAGVATATEPLRHRAWRCVRTDSVPK